MKEKGIILAKIKKIIKLVIVLLVIIGIFFFFLSVFSYFDPLNFCCIEIQEKKPNGSKNDIIKAIKELKKENLDYYKDLCRYVEEIAENRCFNGEPNFSQTKELNGCYIKGSKTIYLSSNKEKFNLGKNDYVYLIKKYSQKSKEFWQFFGKENH